MSWFEHFLIRDIPYFFNRIGLYETDNWLDNHKSESKTPTSLPFAHTILLLCHLTMTYQRVPQMDYMINQEWDLLLNNLLYLHFPKKRNDWGFATNWIHPIS